jgi:hypothetical protein
MAMATTIEIASAFRACPWQPKRAKAYHKGNESLGFSFLDTIRCLSAFVETSDYFSSRQTLTRTMSSIIARLVLLVLLFLLFSRGTSSREIGLPKVIGNRLRMTPDDSHRVVEANSNLTITCTYAFQNDNQSLDHQNISWRWELPSFLTKYPKVRKIID